MNTSDATMDRWRDIAQERSDTISRYDFSQKGHMRHDEQNDIGPNHGGIRGLGATRSWCVVLSIVIGPVCFLYDSGADEGGINNETRSAPLSTSSGGGSCDSLPSIEDQPGTEGSASNCQKQDGDLVAHEYNGTRQHFYRIKAPFGAKPKDVNAEFVKECNAKKPNSSCINYEDAYKKLIKLAFDTAEGNRSNIESAQPDSVKFPATLSYAQTNGTKIELTEEPGQYSVWVPRDHKDWKTDDFTDEQRKRLAVRTTMTHAEASEHARDHENDQWRLVQAPPGPHATKLGETNTASTPKRTNICGGEDRLAMIMFGRVYTNSPHSWSPLSLDMVLRLKGKEKKINTEGLEMVIVCETAMTAKCAYEHGYRPWATLKDRLNRAVPPEDVAALLSTCALASTQCTREGNHIVVIDDLGMNRPYPLGYGKTYFDYEATFRYLDNGKTYTGPHREHICRLRDVEISARCQAKYNSVESREAGKCEADEHRDKEVKYDAVKIFGYIDMFLIDQNLDWKKAPLNKGELLITEDGRWLAGKKTGLEKTYSLEKDKPRFGKNERRVVILSQPVLHPTHPAGALPGPKKFNMPDNGKITLNRGHFSTWDDDAKPEEAEEYLWKLKGTPFDHVTCRQAKKRVVCFLYKSQHGDVTFSPDKARPEVLYQLFY